MTNHCTSPSARRQPWGWVGLWLGLVSGGALAETAITGPVPVADAPVVSELPPTPSAPAAAAPTTPPPAAAESRALPVPGAVPTGTDATAAPSAPVITAPAPNGSHRLALVIGNNAYADAPLQNPANDAREIAKALQDSGFEVILKLDADLVDMQGTLREFGDRLKKDDTSLFYFAGHGMQINGRNYLIPVGANIQRETEVAGRSVDAQEILGIMEAAGSTTNLMILDACRNNPFIRSSRSAASKGLAQMDAPVGTLVAFATAPGSVSSDGTGSHGLYTDHLLRALRTPGLKVEEVFKQVRAGVRRESQGKQVPWESTSLEGDFYFKGAGLAMASLPAPVAVPVSVAPAAPAADPELDHALWNAISRIQQAGAYENYLRRFPTGLHAAEALQRMVSLASAGAQAAQERTVTRNANGYEVGDAWEFRVVDRWRDQILGLYTVEVGAVRDDGSLETTAGGLLDNQGRLKKMPSVPGTASRVFVPFRPSWWDSAFASATSSMSYRIDETDDSGAQTTYLINAEAEVKDNEKITVPAGTFNTQRIELTESVRVMRGGKQVGSERWETTYWYAPELRYHVAMEHNARETIQGGRPTRRDREELVSFSRQTENQASR